MKIVLLGPVYPYRGGIAHYTTMLAQVLAEGHELEVLSFSRQYPAWLYPGRSDKDEQQRLPRVPAQYLLDSINPWTWWRAAGWVKRCTPDLLVIQWWVTFLAPAYFMLANLCRKAGIPILYIIHNVLPHEGGRIHPLLARLTLSQGNFFLVHTEVQRQRLLGLLPKAQIAVCPFPAYTGFSEQVKMPEQQEARLRLGLPEDEPILLFFGIVRPYKGLMVLIEALKILHNSGLKAHLVVAGEFWEDIKPYQEKLKAYSLSGFSRLENRYISDDEVGLFFAAADVSVAPYVEGTQSAVVAMAQAYGKPVVMTEKSAAGVDVTRLDPKIIVPPGDAQALAEAIQYQLSQPAASYALSPDVENGWPRILAVIESFKK